MSFPWWVHLLRAYSWYFPVLRGKSRIVRWVFSRWTQKTHAVQVKTPYGIQMELWPWIWADFCTYMLGSPEPYHLAYFSSRIHRRSVVFDIGAYIGVYALRAAQIATEGQVYAFEPNPQSARRLEKAIKLNGIHNLKLYPYALSDRVGESKMTLQDYPPKSSLCVPSENAGQANSKASSGETVRVLVHTLDHFCRSEGVEHIDLLKIDVEGAEMLVLRGGSNIIADSRPEMIVELHRKQSLSFGSSVEEVVDYLLRWEYRLFCIFPGIRNPRLVPVDSRMLAKSSRLVVIAQPTE